MKKKAVLLLALLCVLLLSACAREEAVESAPPTTAPTEPPMADVGGTEFPLDVTELSLGETPYQLQQLTGAAKKLKNVTKIDLGVVELTQTQLEELQQAYPGATIDYSLSLFGQVIHRDATCLDASAMAPTDKDTLLAALPLLPQVEKINFVAKDGTCVFDVENIALLDEIQAALPEMYLRVSFELFGKRLTSEDERIEYYVVPIGNEGVEQIRAVLPYLRACDYFLMDGCGVDDEVMAQLRSDFPETKIVWRIWLVEENYKDRVALRAGSYLTDTTLVRTTYVTDENSHKLNYCTETKYVDVGHVWQITNCEFLRYMPDLEVCILAITYVKDISPLANHEKLEYLELFTTDIQDISALASCPNLEHLNISNMPYINDISPLYGLTKMKRLRMVTSPMIPEYQKEEIARLLPNCEMLNRGYFPTAWMWRKIGNTEELTPRYALLCEQMEYSIDAWEYGIP